VAFGRARGGARRAAPRPGPLRVIAVGSVEPGVLDRTAAVLREVAGFGVLIAEEVVDAAAFLDPARRQYRADLVLGALRPLAAPGERILGVTVVDLCLPVLTYVFGYAELSGIAGVVSAHRLDPRYDGDDDDPGLALERLEKEALHEAGHLLGLTHCPDRLCVMASAHDVGEIDIEEPGYCAACSARL
jgi:archaemetzincin